jgi:cell division protein FtsL
MAKSRVGGGGAGRLRLTFVLVAFLVISGGVILRRTMGISAARELLQLDARRAGLVAERLRLEGEVRQAASRAHLQPIAEQRLQMRVPADSQVIILRRGGRENP